MATPSEGLNYDIFTGFVSNLHSELSLTMFLMKMETNVYSVDIVKIIFGCDYWHRVQNV